VNICSLKKKYISKLVHKSQIS